MIGTVQNTPIMAILCDNHQWAQLLPVSSYRLICVHCGYVKNIEVPDSMRTEPHFEGGEAPLNWQGMTIH